MGPRTSDESRLLLNKYRISFDGPIEPSEWPSTQRVLFKDVQRLGRYTYSGYEDIRKQRSTDEPWGSGILRRADRVTSIAKKCLGERRNEAGWRLSLEPEIFARFTIEVAWYAVSHSYSLTIMK